MIRAQIAIKSTSTARSWVKWSPEGRARCEMRHDLGAISGVPYLESPPIGFAKIGFKKILGISVCGFESIDRKTQGRIFRRPPYPRPRRRRRAGPNAQISIHPLGAPAKIGRGRGALGPSPSHFETGGLGGGPLPGRGGGLDFRPRGRPQPWRKPKPGGRLSGRGGW